MILDARAKFAESAQSETTSAASTDIINTVAAGDSYEGAWFVALVTTSYTAGAGAPTVTFQLQTSDEEDYVESDNITLIQSSAYVAAELVAGDYYACRIPMGCKKYLRAYKSVSGTVSDSNKFSAGAWIAFITKDIDWLITKHKQLGRTT